MLGDKDLHKHQQFCVLMEFLSSDNRRELSHFFHNVLAFLDNTCSGFPSHEKSVMTASCIAGLYILPIVFLKRAHFLCVNWMKILLIVFARVLEGILFG